MRTNYTTILRYLIIFLLMQVVAKSQDTILKTNNELMIVRILEISTNTIKYNLNDKVYTLPKSDVARVSYANGIKDIFSSIQTTKELPIDSTGSFILAMNDGTQLRGKIITETDTTVTFTDYMIGKKVINRTTIKSLKPEFGTTLWMFTLTDGTMIIGKISNKTESKTVIESKNLGKMIVSNSDIKQVQQLDDISVTKRGEVWFKNPNCSRYLFAPSAFCLKKREGYYQNIYGLGNAVNYGLTDHVTIGGGIVGPLGVYLNAKIGVTIAKNVCLAAGGLVGNSFLKINNSNFGFGIGFGVITLGNFDHNITFGAGYGFVNKDGNLQQQNKPLYVINAMARVGKQFALVTENWIVNLQGNPLNRSGLNSNSNKYDTFFSYAFRYMGQRSTLDAGFINTPAIIESGWYLGIPYIGFVIRFGNYKNN